MGIFFSLEVMLLMRLSFDPVENRLREHVKLIRTFGLLFLPISALFYPACVFAYESVYVCVMVFLLWRSHLSQPFDKYIIYSVTYWNHLKLIECQCYYIIRREPKRKSNKWRSIELWWPQINCGNANTNFVAVW